MGNELCRTCLEPHGFRSGRDGGGGGGGGTAIKEHDCKVGTRPANSIGGRPPRVTGKKKAVLIGINYEGTSAQLRGCVNDVKRMKGMLKQQYGFQERDLQILTDERGGNSSTMPTRSNILKAARWLVQGVEPGDVLFFHFSGHGAQQEDPRYSEEDGMDETILPVDFQYSGHIVDDDLFDIICATLPSGAKLTAVMDCCHSGTGLDLPFTYDTYGRNWIEDDNPCHSEGDVQLFSGCEDDQTSADASSLYGAAAGAMTTAFCDVLESNPAPTYPQLLQSLHGKLQSRGFSQRPQLTASQRFDVNQSFEICAAGRPNQNQTVGRHFTKAKHPRRSLMDGDPLGDMLTAVVVSDCLFGGPFGGGLFGDPFGGFGDPYGYGGYGDTGYGGYGDEYGGGYEDGGFDDGGGDFDF